MRRWFFRLIRWSVILGFLGGIGAVVVGPAMVWYQERTKPRFQTVKVNRGTVETVINSTGTVKPVKSISVGAFVSGPIAKIKVDFNTPVNKGDVLAEIDPKLFKAAVRRDEANLKSQLSEKKRIQALLSQAENNEKRALNLMAINREYLSETELDQVRFSRQSLQAQLELADAGIEQARANLENSKANLEYTKITSPVDGIVIERKVDDGQTVASQFQTPEMFIVAPGMRESMHIFASVDEADIGQIQEAEKLNRPVRFSVDAYPRDLFTGKIYQIRRNSTTTQNVVTYPVVINASNPDLKLMPGMTANITFLIESRENVLRVPVAALRFSPPVIRVRPEDRKYLDGTATSEEASRSGTRMSADQKVDLARERSRRLVWIRGETGLQAIPVVLGASNNQFAELLEGELVEGQELVSGIDTTPR